MSFSTNTLFQKIFFKIQMAKLYLKMRSPNQILSKHTSLVRVAEVAVGGGQGAGLGGEAELGQGAEQAVVRGGELGGVEAGRGGGQQLAEERVRGGRVGRVGRGGGRWWGRVGGVVVGVRALLTCPDGSVANEFS